MRFSKDHPEAWEFFKEHARNIMDCPEVNQNGRFAYRIPVPDRSGNFIYAEKCITQLIHPFLLVWYKPSINSPSVYGKIQYITDNF